MVEQPGATCPGSPGGATASLGQVRHRLGSGVDLAEGGGYGASAGELRDRTAQPTTSSVGFSAQGAAGHAATLSNSGGTGSPPNFTMLSAGDLTADTNPAGREQLSSSSSHTIGGVPVIL
jgi:hypothetical protein